MSIIVDCAGQLSKQQNRHWDGWAGSNPWLPLIPLGKVIGLERFFFGGNSSPSKTSQLFCSPRPCNLSLAVGYSMVLCNYSLSSQKLPSTGACCLSRQDFLAAGTTSLPTSLGHSWVEAHPSPPVSSLGSLGSGLLLAACPRLLANHVVAIGPQVNRPSFHGSKFSHG